MKTARTDRRSCSQRLQWITPGPARAIHGIKQIAVGYLLEQAYNNNQHVIVSFGLAMNLIKEYIVFGRSKTITYIYQKIRL